MFGLTLDEVVVVDRITGPTTHPYPHEKKASLTFALEAGAALEIKDDRGVHVYPPAAVLGLHFTTSPNTSGCRVQLWEGPDGLYLVDPFDEDRIEPTLWPIRRGWVSARATFRTLAARLCEQSMQLPEAAGNAQTLSRTPGAVHVATWHQRGARVVMEEEAGPRAQALVGADDLSAQPRT